jgi:V8-like Glu-specific endopeptidase
MLTIELDPPLRIEGHDGRYSFEDHNQAIRFGRDVDRDVRFRPDATSFGRKHFELRPSASSYEIVTDREHLVFINGMRIEGSMTLLPNAEIRLNDPETGPLIRITVDKGIGLPPTEKPKRPPGRTPQERMRDLRRAVAALAVAGVVAGAYFYLRIDKNEQALAAFAGETKTVIAKLDEKVTDAIPPDWVDISKKVSASVYQVVIETNDGKPPVVQATAWVYGPHILVTNSHAAKLYEDLGPSKSLKVVAPDGQQTMAKVIAPPKLHPAYDRFREVIADVEKNGKPVGQVGSYDVAFLEVDNSVQLAPPLTIDREIDVGQEIGVLGYPSAFAKNETASQFRVGVVSGSTDFLGIAKGTKGELIYHTADGAWGASGSPIFNKEGKVVAIFSGGEARQVGKTNIISGAGTFYAQSASLIDDLTAGWSTDKMDVAVVGWKSEALYLSRKNTVWAMLMEYGNPNRFDTKAFPPVFDEKGTLGKDGSAQFLADDLEPGTYIAFASWRGAEQGAQPLRFRVMVDGQAIQSPLYLDKVPTAIFKAEKGKASFVLTGAADAPYWLQLHRFEGGNIAVAKPK